VTVARIRSGAIELPAHFLDPAFTPSLHEAIQYLIDATKERQNDCKNERKPGLHKKCRPDLPDLFETLFPPGNRADHLLHFGSHCLIKLAVSYVDEFVEFPHKAHCLYATPYLPAM
jgi:hypothetical protein